MVSYRTDQINLSDNINIYDIMFKCLSSFSSAARVKNISIHFNFTGEEEAKIRCDEKKIYRVFENIISNAIKYSPENSEINIIIEKANGCVSIKIIDQGYGIDDSVDMSVLKVGKRLDRDKQISGSGIGLAVVKKFIMMHSGKLSFKKNIDRGTTFTVILPRVPEQWKK